MKKKLKYFDVIQFDEPISLKSIELIEQFRLSDNLQIPDAIIGATFAHLRPSAALYQFTYGWRNPVPEAIMQKYKLRAICLGRVWANIPPAAVYRIERVT